MPLAPTQTDSNPTDTPELRCPGCGTDLALHQPDALRPERLLGTCDGCDSWYVIDAGSGAMAPIPEPVPGTP